MGNSASTALTAVRSACRGASSGGAVRALLLALVSCHMIAVMNELRQIAWYVGRWHADVVRMDTVAKFLCIASDCAHT